MALTLTDRFQSKVFRTASCWIWRAAITKGYGRFWVGGRNGGYVQAHRLTYEDAKGPIPAGMTLDHLCRNRSCVNPSHLEPVSLRVNILRGESPGARNGRKTCCKRGHPYTEVNLYRCGGRRICKTCLADRGRTPKYKLMQHNAYLRRREVEKSRWQ